VVGAEVAVAIVAFNSAESIGTCVESVVRWLPGAEIVVVDNGSTDGPAAATFGAVRVLAGERNVGFGRACNRAAELAGASHVLFLNPDARLVSVDAEALSRALAGAGAFGLRAPALTGSGRPLLRRETSWLRDVVRHAVGAWWPRELHRPGPARAMGGRLWAAAAAVMVRRDEFLGVGGFDPRFFLYYEDRDLSARYREAGLPVGELPGVVAVHAGGGSSGDGGLRAAPLAWEYLGWLEYVAARYGLPRARLALRLTWGPR